MTRLPLIHIPDGLYSVVSKCNNNEFLLDSEPKFELYLKHLLKCKNKLGFKIYDIVCLSNHVHELYRVTEKVTIAQILHIVRGGFSKKFNELFGRTGHFWKSKCYYRIIEDEQYAYNTMNYFHLNPVKAGLVEKPEDWPYSGYCFHILNQRTGILGKLLDPLPNAQNLKIDKNILRSIEKLFKKRLRFIGSKSFCKTMRDQYSSRYTKVQCTS